MVVDLEKLENRRDAGVAAVVDGSMESNKGLE